MSSKLLRCIVLVGLWALAGAAIAQPASRTLTSRDMHGNYTGKTTCQGDRCSQYDANGNMIGWYKRQGNTITYYDANGNFIGSETVLGRD